MLNVKLSIFTQFKNRQNIMIVHKDDYYQIQDIEQPLVQQPPQQPSKPKEKTFELQGNSIQRLKLIRQRFEELKRQKKNNQTKITKSNINLSELTKKQDNIGGDISISIMVPKEIKELEKRTNDLEEKFKCNEVIRQKMERKGNLVSRINSLLSQLAKLQNTSPDQISKNILQYVTYAEQREQLLKIMFLYQAFTTTQGLRQEIDIIQTYLKNLQGIKLKLNSAVSIETMVKDHNELLKKRREVSVKIHELFEEMKKNYQQLSKQIDDIGV